MFFSTDRSTFVRTLVLTFLISISSASSPISGQSCSTPSFTQPPVYAAGRDVRALASADFDSDGHADVAAVDVNSDSLTVFMKLAENIPAVSNSYATGHFPLAVVTGDFNGDGKPDIITGNSSSSDLSLLLNDGTGHFISAGVVPVPNTPQSIAVGDFNLDGKPDLAIVPSTSQNVTVLLGNGQGGFGPAHFFSAGRTPSRVVAADFSGDGKLDLAVTIPSPNPGIEILTGDGTGSFVRVASACAPATASTGFAAGDLNGDAKADIVIADALGAQIHVLLNNGSGCFTSVTDINVLNFGRPRSITLGDLNNDGKLDIIADRTILIGNGSGGFTAPIAYGSGSASEANTATGDFDGDGKLDIASAGRGSLSLLMGDGAGGIKNAGGPAELGVFGAAVGDMNSDSKPDLVYFTTANANIMLGNGTGGFAAPLSFPVTNPILASPVLADFNGDTKLDVCGSRLFQ